MELIVFPSRKACEKLSGNYENRENVIVDFYNNVTNVMKKNGSSRNISIICSCKKLNYALIDIQCLDIKSAQITKFYFYMKKIIKCTRVIFSFALNFRVCFSGIVVIVVETLRGSEKERSLRERSG